MEVSRMNPIKLLAIAILVAALAAALSVGVVLAHGQSVGVDPASAKPGDTIALKGRDLGVDRAVKVKIVGTGVERELGEAQTDDDGAFTAQYKVPADLMPGPYQIQAEGKETATTDFAVLAAGGAGDQMAGQTSGEAAPAAPAQPGMPVRERPLSETAGLVALFGVLAGLGLFFAQTARRQPVSEHASASVPAVSTPMPMDGKGGIA
jgi:hypothetical protein